MASGVRRLFVSVGGCATVSSQSETIVLSTCIDCIQMGRKTALGMMAWKEGKQATGKRK
jgi:hypothetical protein